MCFKEMAFFFFNRNQRHIIYLQEMAFFFFFKRYQLRNVQWTLIVTQLACLEPQNISRNGVSARTFFIRLKNGVIFYKVWKMAFFATFDLISAVLFTIMNLFNRCYSLHLFCY